ncbi:hypothetical protein JKP12_21930 [Vibrio vulnificus]|nr:hypothetical protein [Vibrio vulnificus]
MREVGLCGIHPLTQRYMPLSKILLTQSQKIVI